MGDYCHCSVDAVVGNVENVKRTVRLRFVRQQLLYDIRNYAYIEGDVLGEEHQHAQHVLVEIGESGNVDRVTRILSAVHASVVEMLYPWTKSDPVEEEIDDCLYAPDAYIVELHVPLDVSRTTMHLLSRLIHEYMVYEVLADWLSITHPQSSANWASKAEATERAITQAKSTHRGVFTRQSHPW